MSNGIYLPRSENSSRVNFEYHPISSNVKESNLNNSTTATFPPYSEYSVIEQLTQLKLSVADLKRTTEESRTFFKESVFLQRVCSIVIILLPIFMVAITGIVIWFFSTDLKMVKYAEICLGFLGLASSIDLVFIFVNDRTRAQRIELIEKRLDLIEREFF